MHQLIETDIAFHLYRTASSQLTRRPIYTMRERCVCMRITDSFFLKKYLKAYYVKYLVAQRFKAFESKFNEM